MQVRSRPAFTLVESVIVLGVMGVLITSFTLIPRSEKQVGRNEEFYIDVREDHVNVDGQVIQVPANWTGGLRVIRCQVFTMAPISFALYNKETMRRRNVVFQLGGGTFHVDP